jgi:hypothetical protein
MNHGDCIRPTDQKLFRVHSSYSIDYAISFAGTIVMGLAFVEWVKGGMIKGEYPIKNIDQKQIFHCLLVRRNGIGTPTVQYFGNDLIGLLEVDFEYLAEGRGDEFALGAMHHGATAVEAIQAANHNCAFSGYGVNYIDVPGDFEIKRIIVDVSS